MKSHIILYVFNLIDDENDFFKNQQEFKREQKRFYQSYLEPLLLIK